MPTNKPSKPVELVRRSKVSLFSVEIVPAADAADEDQLQT